MGALLDLPDYGSLILAVSWALTAICSILIIARLYTCIFITRRLKPDLYIAVFVYVCPLVPGLPQN